MKAQDDFQRCFASRLRQSSRTTTSDDDPMDAAREALWSEMNSGPRVSAPALDSDAASARIGISLMKGDIPQSSEHTTDEKDDGYTRFHRMCSLPVNGPMDPRWQDVRQYLSDLSPDDAEEVLTSTQKEGFDYTPLHIVCFLSPPVDVVKQMVALCPESVKIATNHGDYAVGLACGGFVPAGGDVVRALVVAYPEARDEANSRNECPLHIHVKIMRKYELDPCPVIIKLLATVQAVNTRDIKGHSPVYYLGRASTDAFSLMGSCVRFFSLGDKQAPSFDKYWMGLGVMVTLDPGRDSKTLFLRDLLQYPKNLRDAAFEKKATREVINNIVGRGQYIALLMMDFYIQLSVVVAYTLGCSDRFQKKAYTTVMLVGSAYWLLKRFASALGSSESWTKVNSMHMMNVVQAILLMASSMYLRKNGIDLVEEGTSGPWRNILIVNSVLIWLTLMGIACHAMKGFSVFVHATVQIFKKLFNLFLVYAVIFMAFSTMFFLSAVDSPGYCAVDGESSGNFCTLEESMKKVSTLFFGTLEADDFYAPSPTRVTLFMFNVIVIILLLNIIIAVMSDVYAEVADHAELVFWDHRFELIQDVDAITNSITQLSCCFTNRGKKPKITQEGAQGVATMIHDWFGDIIHNRSRSKIPKPLYNLLTFIVMAIWVLVGLCTFGLFWPRHARRNIFAPSVSDHLTEDEGEFDVEIEQIKKENYSLEHKNSMLIKENESLRKMLDTFQNKLS